MKKGGNKEINWLRNTIMLLYNAATSLVATRSALAERLQISRNTASLLLERAKQKLGCGQQFNPFVPSAPFIYPLKTSENSKVFDIFRS